MASLVTAGPSGFFYAQFYDKDRRPQRRRVPLRTRQRRAAERALQRLEVAFALGEFDPWAPPTSPAAEDALGAGHDLERLGPAARAFLDARAHLRPNTLRTYREVVLAFARHHGDGFPVGRLTARHVAAWLDATRAGDVTRRKYAAHLGYLFRFLVGRGAMTHDVSKGVALRRVPETAPKAMTRAEVDRLLAEIARPDGRRRRSGGDLPPDRDWLYDLVAVNVHLGLRRGELCHLRWAHVDLDRGVVCVANTDEFTTKSGRERAVPLSCDARDRLRRRRERFPAATYVFEVDGHRLVPGTASERFRVFVRRAGLPRHLNLHSTRHTFGTWLADRGVPLHVLQRLMGHASVTVTERYLATRPEALVEWVSVAFA